MSWVNRVLASINTNQETKGSVPGGVWTKCIDCESVLYQSELIRNSYVCPKCDYHLKIDVRSRLINFFDKDTEVREFDMDVEPVDFLKFVDLKKYKDRISASQKATGDKDTFITQIGKIEGVEVVVGAFNFDYMGGSMGSVVGEKFVRAVNYAIEREKAFICFATSGGARMQEGLTSLMQMAKTSAALGKLREAKLPFISVLTNPTMGGVSASFAMLGDINIAEPKALIGFAGPRVIEQTVREKLPEGFQKSEFLLEKGAIDMVVDRRELKTKIASIIKILLA